MVDIDEHGGLPVLMKELLVAGLLHGECITCTGKTVAENLAAVPTVDEVNRSLPAPQQARPRPYHVRAHSFTHARAQGSVAT